ncbi:MAG TPA: type II toxin-antitoxin system ParD family antitoxin [Acidobacteriota bacterium]|nr:type II toxin-antitoxin system ParD family antitoxin [Acidobacteriota bacterium]
MATNDPLASLNFEIPESLREWIEGEVARCDYASASEYLQELVRQDQRRKEKRDLDAKLLAGLGSGRIEATDEYIEEKIRLFKQRYREQLSSEG